MDWSPAHLDAVLTRARVSDLEAEYGIGGHHWTRLRPRLADRQDPSCWYPDMAYVNSWKIGDLRRFVLRGSWVEADANGVPGILLGTLFVMS